ncbi:hypothetical protein MJO28_002944 [Puccinia striiformis f. sp. tritici]|uniref:50S ribosomal protein L31, chloroplastic n=3 Tax=Puccinia striiformis TaxID=27350 RepID=A0A0L0VJ87_9BASI|nr:hypothetical protein Pst134EB_006175 [Puccinia striiformis f. sp. tritici]KAI9629477.1 hypothetical protein KEM48_012946 [Puccinia striiformis f. sp. tritici PST-130]KNE99345.1 hypothetical protein PSTG_07463 [Puccinia striiformis f. sp. tritici PST-78]POW21354.1 hypothetical protein PSHT_02451 [Puccinia striiformis]KAI7959153.1 hypothetical protein MJO28_002944 [Puccinia striiformis f. sp. tritici]
MSTFGLQSRHLTRCCSWQTSSQARLQQSSRSASSLSSAVVQPMAPIFNRREKKKLRNSFPRPDKSPQVLHPALPPSFVNRVTMADGSSFYLTTRSPRPSIALARDVTNHPLWNPSLAREVADQDQSGRMGRFARRYGGPKLDPTASQESTESLESQSDPQSTEQETQNQASQPKQPEVVNQSQSALDKHGFGVDDLQWISGESKQSFYGVGNARNIRGMKKVWVKK